MKRRTLLFGAGQGALQYMTNLSEECEFIGFLDNDEDKHGRTFEGLPIYSPKSLRELIFDEIVISTQWALDVQNQLLNELNVPPSKVILPNKNQLKKATPFVNPSSLLLGRHIIVSLNAMAMKQSIPLVADFGTLLGLVRDSDIIHWDDDIDFSVPLDFADSVENLLLAFVRVDTSKVRWKVERVEGKNNNFVGLLLKFDDPDGLHAEFTTSVCFRELVDGKSVHMPSLGMWYSPEKHFNDIDTLSWRGESVQVPSEYKEYLTFQYGDWNVPKKDIQLSDYANLQKIDFADVQQAKFSAKIISGNE